ncbi:MAG: aminotransferase class III-fold pyridoxal phosphate-dependent enzyme [Candidatus Niyogibacteria bacterium]|nr:aminotransferase class III-fold pyridoxal phosphate-dependent enzyme [Candidatus Niyogibacteria bacterium]
MVLLAKPAVVIEDLDRYAKEWIRRHDRVTATTTIHSSFIPARGEGVELHDIRGNSYIDFTSFVGVCNLGYGSAVYPILDAMVEHFKKTGLAHVMNHDYRNIWATELRERLVKLTPGNHEKKVMDVTSGACAIETAIKLAYDTRPDRLHLLACWNGFHGRNGYALPLMGAKEVRTRDFPLAFPVTHIPFPHQENIGRDGEFSPAGKWESSVHYMRHVEEVVFPIRKEVNALVIELVQGEGGIYPADPEYLYPLFAFCKENDILLVVDEVQTGIGRTGKMFACDHYQFMPDIVPDIVTIAKGICAGLHIYGATIFDARLNFKELGRHSNTFGGNTLAIAAAMKTLDMVEERLRSVAKEAPHSAIEHLRVRLDHAVHAINAKCKTMRLANLRGMGWMLGVDVLKKDIRGYFDFDSGARDAIIACAENQREGVLLIGSGRSGIRLMPPVIADNTKVDEGLHRFENLPIWKG